MDHSIGSGKERMDAREDNTAVTEEASRHRLVSGPACDRRCPICGDDNQCRVAMGCLYKGPCWCENVAVPASMLRLLASEQTEASCLCRPCLKLMAQLCEIHDDPRAVLRVARTAANADFYTETDGRVVFTARFHLKRGTCCGNGCRHCPYQG